MRSKHITQIFSLRVEISAMFQLFAFALIGACWAQPQRPIDAELLAAEDNSSGASYSIYGQATWFMALEICSLNGMRLVRINDQNKNDEVTYFVDKLSAIKGPYWTLASRLHDETTWAFALNDPVKYFNWGPGEPNNASGNEKCIELYKDGQWNDSNCAEQRFVLCEKISG